MKKTVGILSVLLALIIAVNAVIPSMSVTIKNVFAQPPQVASLSDSAEKDSETDDATETAAAVQKQAAYDDGKILIPILLIPEKKILKPVNLLLWSLH